MHAATESSTPPASTDAERYMFEALRRFHRARHYELHALRRTVNGFATATTFRPARLGASPEHYVILWSAAELSIRFFRQPSRAAAMRMLRAYGSGAATGSSSSRRRK